MDDGNDGWLEYMNCEFGKMFLFISHEIFLLILWTKKLLWSICQFNLASGLSRYFSRFDLRVSSDFAVCVLYGKSYWICRSRRTR